MMENQQPAYSSAEFRDLDREPGQLDAELASVNSGGSHISLESYREPSNEQDARDVVNDMESINRIDGLWRPSTFLGEPDVSAERQLQAWDEDDRRSNNRI